MIEIRSLFGEWRAVSEDQARRWALHARNHITTSINREEYINSRLRGTTFAELMRKEDPMTYKSCLQCGATLDPGERCDCGKREKAADARTPTTINQDLVQHHQYINKEGKNQ